RRTRIGPGSTPTTTMFVGPPGLTSELLRVAAREAGVHLFTTNDCNVYANGPYVALHGSKDGQLTLDTAKKAIVRDVLTGGEVGNGPILILPLRRGETRILRIE